MSQVGTWARAVRPLQMAHSILFPRAPFVTLACYFSGNHSCLSGCCSSAPIPACATKPGQQGEAFSLHCFGKKQGALT